MSSLLFLIRPHRIALLSCFSASSSLCRSTSSSFWAFSCKWSACSTGTVLPLVERKKNDAIKTDSFTQLFQCTKLFIAEDLLLNVLTVWGVRTSCPDYWRRRRMCQRWGCWDCGGCEPETSSVHDVQPKHSADWQEPHPEPLQVDPGQKRPKIIRSTFYQKYQKYRNTTMLCVHFKDWCYTIFVIHLASKIFMLKAFYCVLLQLAHPGGLLQLFCEDLVQLYPPPLNDLPLDSGWGFFMSNQQDALELTLTDFVQFFQQCTAL